MRPQDFRTQLTAATFDAIHFAKKFLKKHPPIDAQYVALLNQSYDKNCKDDTCVYPEDDGRIEYNLTERAVRELLLRDGRCPQWIDISVIGADSRISLVQLLCCGRYVGDESEMYYYEQGSQPFGIKSPVLPVGWTEGRRFALPKPVLALEMLLKREVRVAATRLRV